MAELLTAAQMRAIETDAISSGSVSGLDLMERAGSGVVEAILETWPELEEQVGTTRISDEFPQRADGPPRAVVLCGPGNNGGDGFVVARLLHARGWDVRAPLYGDPDKLPPDARANYERWGAVGEQSDLNERSFGTVQTRPDLVVDALFGTGLTRELEGDPAFLLSNLEVLRDEFAVKTVAVDIPSGVCSDSGKALGAFPEVDLTVSFHSEKLGHNLELADTHSAKVVVKDIGLPRAERIQQRSGHVWKVDAPDPKAISKARDGQKYNHGHAMILSGPAGRTGAARLAARGALRIGAGLVTIAVPPNAAAEVAAQTTAIMQTTISGAGALGELLWDTRYNALCVGPGLGLDDNARELVETVLGLQRPVVLDADALTLFRMDPAELFAQLHEKCVITPHGGEFARLFPDLAQKLEATPTGGPAYSKVDATRAAAKRAGCTVLFKGASTIIAAPDGQCALHSARHDRAAPWLATAGSGDVLAGLITGLLARGNTPTEAAEMATWLHAQAALEFGPGLIAEDLPEMLPTVFRKLGA
ncbi:MAG: NAD(P)H-hydrate dehydratase [Rhodobacteraceae bacterium]|nr:NAD(P)H-hydrate dehydratase [Paracoccaceae bacterium]